MFKITVPSLLLCLWLLQQMHDHSPSQSFALARKVIEANILKERKMGKRMKLHDKSGKSTKVKINRF